MWRHTGGKDVYKRQIENCSVSGSVSGTQCVGGVVGAQKAGSITGCSASATVKGTVDVGGVAGEKWGSMTCLLYTSRCV